MIGEPYRWQCEADRCYRQRDRAGRWHAGGRDMGTDDPGAGNRYHPECRPMWECGSGAACFVRHYLAAERAVQPDALPLGVHASRESADRCRRQAAPMG